jgi:hypothetical protein
MSWIASETNFCGHFPFTSLSTSFHFHLIAPPKFSPRFNAVVRYGGLDYRLQAAVKSSDNHGKREWEAPNKNPVMDELDGETVTQTDSLRYCGITSSGGSVLRC